MQTDIYSAGIIVFELYCPFSTEMERYNCIKDLRKNKTIPRTLLVRWSDQVGAVTVYTDVMHQDINTIVICTKKLKLRRL